ncbi:MAG TPA: TIR domain-containing protein, partial [Polyangiaceae bacterium]|nr:TIR domain-containing protein [Polyangiaceae bacterium]
MESMESALDCFISYTSADVAWAQWADWVLREAGYSTRLQVYDFKSGASFVADMHGAIQRARHTLALLSEGYFRSRYCNDEWQSAHALGRLLPVRIRDCTPPGLLARCTYVDLVGLSESDAQARLLESLSGGQQRPDTAPAFPGQSAPRFPGVRATEALPPVWSVPRQRNTFFTGRNALLARLHQRLTSAEGAAPMVLVRGLGGVGKTQVALEYAYRYAADYDGVWWLHAEDPRALASDYVALGRAIGVDEPDAQPESIAETRRVLSHRQRFLLIFDNVDGQTDLDPYLPQGSGQRVLLTTRLKHWHNAEPFPLDVLHEDSAADFLLARTGHRWLAPAATSASLASLPDGESAAPVETPAASDEARLDREAAVRIVSQLGYLPLALEQAAAYIDANDTPLPDYARLLGRYDIELLEKGVARDHEHSVRTTWSLALSALNDTPAAAELLALCAFLAPDAIPLSALQRGARALGAPERGALPPMLARALDDELELGEAKGALLRYSMVSSARDTIAVHRLVQKVTQQRLASDQRTTYWSVAASLVNALFPDDAKTAKNWPECERWLPHARVLVEAPGADQLPEVTANLCNQMGFYLKNRAVYDEAERFCRRAVALG